MESGAAPFISCALFAGRQFIHLARVKFPIEHYVPEHMLCVFVCFTSGKIEFSTVMYVQNIHNYVNNNHVQPAPVIKYRF